MSFDDVSNSSGMGNVVRYSGLGGSGFGSRVKAAITPADSSSSRSFSTVGIVTSRASVSVPCSSSFSSSEKGLDSDSDSPDGAALSL
jgi:hypothetical protein